MCGYAQKSMKNTRLNRHLSSLTAKCFRSCPARPTPLHGQPGQQRTGTRGIHPQRTKATCSIIGHQSLLVNEHINLSGKDLRRRYGWVPGLNLRTFLFNYRLESLWKRVIIQVLYRQALCWEQTSAVPGPSCANTRHNVAGTVNHRSHSLMLLQTLAFVQINCLRCFASLLPCVFTSRLLLSSMLIHFKQGSAPPLPKISQCLLW